MEQRVWHQHYDPDVPTTISYPAQPVDFFLRKSADQLPDNPALIFGGLAPVLGEQHRRITYRELDRLADRFAAGLQQLGLQQGDRVALYMPNCPLSPVIRCTWLANLSTNSMTLALFLPLP